jgi:hypothetical protein
MLCGVREKYICVEKFSGFKKDFKKGELYNGYKINSDHITNKHLL